MTRDLCAEDAAPIEALFGPLTPAVEPSPNDAFQAQLIALMAEHERASQEARARKEKEWQATHTVWPTKKTPAKKAAAVAAAKKTAAKKTTPAKKATAKKTTAAKKTGTKSMTIAEINAKKAKGEL
ncbi:hypothetical protein AB0J38_29765 [Streptomyces sp. NPDC050095]|uniref:hypothetical protein n=1 Tax=unclassified Streptomyces TaxID=2593676 RepID=UPI0034172637